MAAGYDDTVFRRNAQLRIIENVIVRSIFSDEKYFPKFVGPGVPGGSRVSWSIDYSSTDNGGFMTDYTDALPTADDMASVIAYQNKDYAQATSQTYDVLAQQVETNYDGKTTEGFTSYEQRSLENAGLNLLENLSGRYVADLVAMIDDAGTFSDAALTRSTYGLASAETAVGGAFTTAALEDLIEELTTSTYGAANPMTDLFILCSPNQHTNIARASTGAQYKEYNASSDATTVIDGSGLHRVQTFWGIPILVDVAMTTGDILVLRKGTIAMYEHMPLRTKDVDVAAFQKQTGMIKGSNLIVRNPTWNGKLSGVTA
jgi:hypothetical protein